MTQRTITFTGSAQACATATALCRRIRIEPLNGNVARFSVCTSAGGIIKNVAAPSVSGTPAVTVLYDAYEEGVGGALKEIDASEYYVIGAVSDGCKVTIWP